MNTTISVELSQDYVRILGWVRAIARINLLFSAVAALASFVWAVLMFFSQFGPFAFLWLLVIWIPIVAWANLARVLQNYGIAIDGYLHQRRAHSDVVREQLRFWRTLGLSIASPTVLLAAFILYRVVASA